MRDRVECEKLLDLASKQMARLRKVVRRGGMGELEVHQTVDNLVTDAQTVGDVVRRSIRIHGSGS